MYVATNESLIFLRERFGVLPEELVVNIEVRIGGGSLGMRESLPSAFRYRGDCHSNWPQVFDDTPDMIYQRHIFTVASSYLDYQSMFPTLCLSRKFYQNYGSRFWNSIILMRVVDKSCPPDLYFNIRFILVTRYLEVS